MSTMSLTESDVPVGVSVAVVIPTRNRAGLAAEAVRSLLDRPGCHLSVFVSDNSPAGDEARQLADFCGSLNDPRVVYIRPPKPLPMPEHWDWAVRQTMARSDASHFGVHYDRRVTKSGHLGLAARVVARHPGQLLTYSHDQVINYPEPFNVYQTPWTGEVYRIEVSRVLHLTSRARIDDMGHALPILSNCLVPREVLAGIIRRFGDLCNSTGPDSCFTYRFCALNDQYLHFDRPLDILYASHRSNGLGYFRGRTDGDFGDFLKMWGDRRWLGAAPIPGINLGQNMLYHEYELVRRAVGGDRFLPINFGCYLRDLAVGLKWVEDPGLKDALRALLRERGWREEPAAEAPAPPLSAGGRTPARRPLRARLAPRTVVVSGRAWARNMWNELKRRQWFVLFLADYLGIKPPHVHCFKFDSEEKALRYALSCPRGPEHENPYILALEPSEVDPAPGTTPSAEGIGRAES
jgi:hypothetical protein